MQQLLKFCNNTDHLIGLFIYVIDLTVYSRTKKVNNIQGYRYRENYSVFISAAQIPNDTEMDTVWTIHQVSTSTGYCMMLTSSQSSNAPYSRLHHLEEAER